MAEGNVRKRCRTKREPSREAIEANNVAAAEKLFNYPRVEWPHVSKLNLGGKCKPAKHHLLVYLSEFAALKTLDLGLNGLTALPGSIRQLKNLTTLNLAYNKLTTLPGWIDPI